MKQIDKQRIFIFYSSDHPCFIVHPLPVHAATVLGRVKDASRRCAVAFAFSKSDP